MRHLLALLAALTILVSPAAAQTMKALMFNSTNGQVVANTGTNVLTFTNRVTLPEIIASTGEGMTLNNNGLEGWGSRLSFEERLFDFGTNNAAIFVFSSGIDFQNQGADITRTNLGLGLAALTNTSNVTIMRALSGSTNTNHPYSGSISVTGTNNTNTLVFSNGILQSVQ